MRLLLASLILTLNLAAMTPALAAQERDDQAVHPEIQKADGAAGA